MSLSPALQPILNLAKARELLLTEAKSTMPKGAQSQRDHLIATLDTVLDEALAATQERLPPVPEAGLDAISQRAWNYLAERQPHARATPVLPSPYANLQRVFDQRSNVSQAKDILYWIQNAHVFPQVAEAVLSDAQAATDIFMHRCLAQPAVERWITQVRANSAAMDAPTRRNVELMHQLWLEAAGLDEALVEKLSEANTASITAWEAAKPKSDFAAWLPHFERVVELTRQKAAALGKALGVSPYQALLGSYDFNRGLRNETVNDVFADMRARLPGLIRKVMEKQAAESPPLPLPTTIPLAARQRVMRRVMKALGLDENTVRLDASEHPFSIGRWDDRRITADYANDSLMTNILDVVHEAGHSFYEGSLPRDWKGQPLADPMGFDVHEGQSIFWERQIAASPEFMEFLSGVLKEELKGEVNVDGPEWSPENLYKLVTRVKPSLIRTDADEVTYPAHVILRHDLEQKIIDGSLAPKDVPAAWAKGMKELLGVDVPDHEHGCMQDMHWVDGSFGYFPAYPFGALEAAQLMEKLKQDMPDVGEHIRRGDFAPIHAWLGDKIHRHGSRYTSEELIENATGKPLSAEAWFHRVEERYLNTGTKWRDQKSQRQAGGHSAAL